MGEIKSTLDLVLEKTKNLTLSSEEKEEQKQKEIDLKKLEENWRKLYYFAWADFHRFMKGWAPGHYKKNSYSERITERIIDQINKGENPN